MSLLHRYQRRTTRLSLYKQAGPSTVKRMFLSAKNPSLPPLSTFDAEPMDNTKPESEPIADFDMPTSINHSSRTPEVILERTPALPPISSPSFGKALDAKIKIITTECNFESPEADISAKKVKSETLNEILALAQSQIARQMDDDTMEKLICGAEFGIFRPETIIPAKFLFSDDFSIITEQAWPHISIGYKILIILINNFPNHRHFNEAYVNRVIDRFGAPAREEKSQLVNVVLNLRSKHKEWTPNILQRVLNITVDHLDKVRTAHAVVPALAVFTNIIIHTEMDNLVSIYHQYILPLLGSVNYNEFHSEMIEIINIYADTYPEVITPTISALMQHFPKTKPAKAVNFLRLIVDLIPRMMCDNFRLILSPVFTLFMQCLCSTQTKVSEAAFTLWQNPDLEYFIAENSRWIFQIVLRILNREGTEAIWSSDIIKRKEMVYRILIRIDGTTLQELSRGSSQNAPNLHVKKWAAVMRSAAKFDKQINLAAKLSQVQKLFGVTGTPPNFPTSHVVASAKPQPLQPKWAPTQIKAHTSKGKSYFAWNVNV